jgi:DNA processing protein
VISLSARCCEPAARQRPLPRSVTATLLSQPGTPARLASWERAGLRILCSGDPKWPTQLGELGDARPLVLWLRGRADLRFACLRSVSVVGARAATAYGTHVATEMAAALAERGWAVISGGPYSIETPSPLGLAAACVQPT